MSRWKTLPKQYAALAKQYGVPVMSRGNERNATVRGHKPGRTAYDPDNRSEYEHQVALIEKCMAHYQQAPERYPGLHLINASANGGLRRHGVAGKLKASGVQDGFPDLELPVARGGYYGLYIELKRPVTGRERASQQAWQKALREQGYMCEFEYGEDAAWQRIEAYYRLPPTQTVQ